MSKQVRIKNVSGVDIFDFTCLYSDGEGGWYPEGGCDELLNGESIEVDELGSLFDRGIHGFEGKDSKGKDLHIKFEKTEDKGFLIVDCRYPELMDLRGL